MMIADEIAHRALAYLAAATHGGGTLSAEDPEAYLSAPEKFKRRYESLLTENIYVSIASMADAIGRGKQISPGETWGNYLLRVRWAVADKCSMRLTELGRNILRHMERPVLDVDGDDPIAVIIDPKDAFAHIRVFELIASHGGGMVVHPYLGTKELLDVLSAPSVKRVPMGSNKVKRHTLMTKALGVANDPPEVRWVSQAELHDRFFIPGSDDVLTFGSSLNTLTRRPGVVIPFGDPALTEAIRSAYGALWDRGTELVPDAENAGL
ncbi:hypothetical protein [Plantibacter sp. YIM 135347]|uniref:hypothetical protein n=1 Tax=Plantibacter sp. YIM 135347 TaxID=3423919 RepID=UPI003D35513C